MSAGRVSVDVLICTFRRPAIRDTLRSLELQRLPDTIDLRIVVCDNDEVPSAAETVAQTARSMTIPVTYLHAPSRNISIARNAGLAAASARGAHWVAFIDDDETAAPDWLATIYSHATASGADAVFGPSVALYGSDAPAWMRHQDHHSNYPVRRDGVVETGHTCNAFLRWEDTPWRADRFDVARGRAGGEDTEFFFRLHRQGANFDICEEAVVTEGVAPDRLNLPWLLRRKYRSGQSHASGAQGGLGRLALGLSALGKVLVCTGCAAFWGFSRDRRNFWLLRGALHVGVISGCLAFGQPEIYGTLPKG